MEKINMKQAALDYSAEGSPIFPLVPNGKKPLTKNGFKDATLDADVINRWWDKWPDANIGIPTGNIIKTLILDVDCKDGKDGNSSLHGLENNYTKLPDTRRHNTPSGGYHLLFRYNNTGLDIPSSACKISDGLDIRADGGYIVAPHSEIDGNKYEVVNPDTPIAEVPDWLIELARAPRLNIINEISKGCRNEHIFKVALECNKKGVAYEDAVEAVIAENRRCSPPLEAVEVKATLDSAYRYEVDAIHPEVEELNRKHAVVMVGGKCRVLNEIQCPIFNRPDISLSTPTDFMNRYANRKVEKMPLGTYWFNHAQRRQLEGIVFAPGKDTPGQYNLWRGFAVAPKEGDCSLYLAHIKDVVCSGDEKLYDYIVGWMAHSVQNIDDLVGTAIVLKGKQGAGKGIFVREFGRLFGGHFTHISQSSHLTGKFNAHLKQTIVLFADEACWGGDKQAEGPLKALITEPTLLIEGKGQDPITVKNHVHVLVSSNNDWVVPCGPEERRFLVLEVSDKRAQDPDYFGAIQNQMNNGGREALLHYLMNYDLSGIDLRKFPKTGALLETKLISLTPVQKFWYHVLETGSLLPNNQSDWLDGVVEVQHLYDKYKGFVQDIGVKHKATDTELGMQLKNMIRVNGVKKSRPTIKDPFTGKSSRKNCYTFQSLADCRLDFDRFINATMDWPKEE